MNCEYCFKGNGRHVRNCPLYQNSSKYYCSICGESINDGEEYIESENFEYAHYDCLSVKNLIEFLGYKVKTMESDGDIY